MPAAPNAPAVPARAADWAAVVAVAVPLAALAPFLVKHVGWLWARPHYGSFPLVLVGAAVLALARPRAGATRAPGRPWLAALGVALGWLLLAGAEVLGSTWLACLSAMALVPALAYGLGGAGTLRRTLPAWALLWLLVPPPMDLDRLLILKLQALTSAWSSSVLDALGVFHLVAGNVLEIDGRALMVEQACSGINSLFSLLSVTLFLVLLTRRGWVRGGLLVGAAVGWTLAANVARVVLVALLETRWGVTAATGWRHEALGLALFAVAVGLLLSTDQFLAFLLNPGPDRDGAARPPAAPAPAEPPVPAPPRRGWIAALVVPAFLALIGLHWATAPDAPAPQAAPGPLPADPDLLPAKIGPWTRGDFGTEAREAGSFFGEHSQAWAFATGTGGAAKAALAYPFPGWHDLTWCYRGTGWQIDAQHVHAPDAVPGGFVEVRLSKPGSRRGYLLFCEFDRQGNPFRARPGGTREPLFRHEATLDRLRDRLAGRPAPPSDPPGAAYQFQVLAEGTGPLSADDEAAVRELFVRGQAAVRARWSAGK